MDAVSIKYEKIKEYDDLNSVDIVAKYEDAKEIICQLVEMEYGIAFINEFGNPEWDGYDDAFVISLLDDEIWCEPIKRKNGYIFVEADVVYIFDDCNSKIISKIESDDVYEVGIGDYDDNCDYECTCPECKCSATYKVNGKNVDKDEYEKAVDKFHDKYMNGIASMLLGYSEFLDEMNEWHKLKW